MTKYSILGSFLAASLLFAATEAAFAGCAEDIKELEVQRPQVNFVTGNKEAAYERILAQAKEALKQGKKKRCAKLVNSARAKMN